MTVQEIRDVIQQADPDAWHYDATAAMQERLDFTVWMEYQRTGLEADDALAECGWRFEVDRYTKTDYDPMAEAIEAALRQADNIILRDYRVMYDVGTGYIRHVFDCEAI